jgi:hypothetical protein
MKVLQFKHSDIKSSQCSQGVTVVLEPKWSPWSPQKAATVTYPQPCTI